MGFIQIIEYTTTRADEVRALVDKHRDTIQAGFAVRGTATQDRDRPGTYLNIVEFESWETAQQNSSRPEISAFSQEMAALCDGPPTFYNLDVVEAW